ncbi:hypothetical protein COU16_00290 [Candidatus Kaiserbacteria bacterium CG10_big_fil_rev_8_21_14_0_10_47_16]|uniref:Uncharacterized protein n=1 Tax=Candidatus Kaiserbacteria bacterium CG10_big_fil_rev_8_21_14_0_10_47_16 TaxID=1974608 RepID=A0A2H0UER8_9BACT|nr:MAG: hypothetical protein COU16_00290 [Candidatus Kaiserbacteria bacterium CG10_big_fil_rev_8_21_14_0_10_47_16]
MATKKKAQTKGLSGGEKVGIGVGLTAAAVGAAGAYFLYGSKNAAKNRTKVKSWALKAKAEVLEALEDAEHMTKQEYDALVDAVGGAYTMFKGASKGEIADFKKEMKSHWSNIEKSGVVKRAQKVANKVMKKTATKPKKVAKKAAKKATKKTAAK